MIIRQMKLHDIDDVLEIERSCFESDAWPRESFEEIVEGGNPIFMTLVAEANSSIVGYISTTCVEGELDIGSVAVDKKYRRKGVAKALISEALRLQDPSTAYLEVRASNAPARALYRCLGFEEMYIRKGYYTQPHEDALIMRLCRKVTDI